MCEFRTTEWNNQRERSLTRAHPLPKCAMRSRGKRRWTDEPLKGGYHDRDRDTATQQASN
ncbi:MAG: hypothetical protein JWL61_2381 [Gemmatimonadetes bacterium]|nr:hypothetical protein [Gemmatimonadota bacterium]